MTNEEMVEKCVQLAREATERFLSDGPRPEEVRDKIFDNIERRDGVVSVKVDRERSLVDGNDMIYVTVTGPAYMIEMLNNVDLGSITDD